jgi:hypothetical protein
MAARGQGFKSPQLHQAQRIDRAPAQGRLPEICQKTRPVAAGTLSALSGRMVLEGLLSDLQHHREPLLDRRLTGAVDRRAGVGSTVATVKMSTIRPPSRRRAGWRRPRPWRDRHGVVERLLGRLSVGHQRHDPALLTRRSRAPRRRPASSNSRRTVRQVAEVGPDRHAFPPAASMVSTTSSAAARARPS